MIETILNNNKELFFSIADSYRVFVNKRTHLCDIYIVNRKYCKCGISEHLLTVDISYYNMKRFPIILDYLEKISKTMEGEDVNRRLLRIFLLIVEG